MPTAIRSSIRIPEQSRRECRRARRQAPLTATFIGASFWAAGVLIYWSSRQRLWVRARLTVPAIAVVVALGAAGVRLAWRDGRYAVTRVPGGVPVELVRPAAAADDGYAPSSPVRAVNY